MGFLLDLSLSFGLVLFFFGPFLFLFELPFVVIWAISIFMV